MKQKTLARSDNRAEIAQRFAILTPDSQRLWGSMSVGGMFCHVDDSYRGVTGALPLTGAKLALPPRLAKFVALRLPMQWPRNLMTAESVRQGGGGTPPGEFAADQARLLETFERFCGYGEMITVHPFFGSMKRADWLRWGYLHADHHLRQFGA